MKQFIVTGIGTDVGKTVVSAILSEAGKAFYWKPVQAGDLNNSDSIKVGKLAPNSTVLEERFRLTKPMSPHAAARIDGVFIEKPDFELPKVNGNLIIEGAGGLLVPVNDNGLTYADLFSEWQLPTIVVSKNYLGSINHTLLTIEVLKSRGIEIEGIIFNGEKNEETESIILNTTDVKCLGNIPMTDKITTEFIQQTAKQFSSLWA